jgi:hypothetical protein
MSSDLVIPIKLFLISFTIMGSILMVFEIFSELSKKRQKKNRTNNGYIPFTKKIKDDSDEPKFARTR